MVFWGYVFQENVFYFCLTLGELQPPQPPAPPFLQRVGENENVANFSIIPELVTIQGKIALKKKIHAQRVAQKKIHHWPSKLFLERKNFVHEISPKKSLII